MLSRACAYTFISPIYIIAGYMRERIAYKRRASVNPPQGGLDQLIRLGKAHHNVRVLFLKLLATTPIRSSY
jgi:hypothetical protein